MPALKYNPMDGSPLFIQFEAAECRTIAPGRVWRFNPWTGSRREAADIASDPQGYLIQPPDEPLYAALRPVEPAPEAQDTANPKDAAGRAKVPLWLLSPIAKAAWAGAAFIGKVKYGAWNYRGTKVYASVYISAAMRHLDAYLGGETHDLEDGTHHLGNVMACCAILLDCAASGNLIDDRPPSVSLRPAYGEMQALIQPTEAKYADRTVKHWTIDDTKTP